MDNDLVAPDSVPQGQTDQAAVQSPDVKNGVAAPEVTQAPDGTTYEELAAKKGFKSPDDLAKAYSNIESHSTRVAQEKADLEKMFFPSGNGQAPSEGQSYSPRVASADMTDTQALDELKKFVQQEAVLPLKAEFNQRLKTELERRDLRQLLEKNPEEMGRYAQDIKEVKSKYPDMPFEDALTFVKATKGDMIKQARVEGAKEATQAAIRQAVAQVAPEKTGKESKTDANDLLAGASKRWKPDRFGRWSDQQKAEIEAVENEIFGETLNKTSQGI